MHETETSYSAVPAGDLEDGGVNSKNLDEIEGSVSKEPEDAYNLAYLIMLLLGAGLLFPYNAMLAAVDYWDDVYPGKDLTYWVPLVMMITGLTTQVLMIKYGHILSFKTWISTNYAGQVGLLVMLPLVDNFTDPSKSIYVTYTLMGIFGISSAILQNTVYAFAAIFPSKYMQAIMGGNGLAGVVVCIVRILTKAGFASDKEGNENSALVFFVLSAIMMVFCTFAYLVLLRLPFAQSYILADKLASGGTATSAGSVNGDDGAVTAEKVPYRIMGTEGSLPVEVVPAGPEMVAAKQDEDGEIPLSEHVSSLGGVFRKIWLMVFTVCMVFVLTFLVFPGVLTKIPTEYSKLNDWFTILLLTEFNVFDLIGRFLAKNYAIFSYKTLWMPVMARAVFTPLMILCVGPRVFSHDIWAYIFVALFAITNGHLASVAMMMGPTSVEPHERQTAGMIMTFALNTGIAIGSAVAIGMSKGGVAN